MALASELITKLVADTTDFTRKMDAATKNVNSFGAAAKSAAKIGAAAFAAVATSAGLVYYSINKLTAGVDDLGKTAQKMGVDFESFQGLAAAAKLADVSTGTLQAGMSKLTNAIMEARTEGSEASTTFKRLGLDANELASMSFDEQYITIADALQQIGNSTERASLQMKLFGKGGIEQTNLLNSNIRAMKEEWESYGLVLTEAQRQQAETFQDTKTFTGMVFSGFGSVVASEVAPAFTMLLQEILKGVGGFGNLRDAARSTAAFMIDMIAGMVDGFESLLPILDKVIDKINQMQIGGRAGMLHKWAVNGVSNLMSIIAKDPGASSFAGGFSVDPSMIGGLSNSTSKSNLAGYATGAGDRLRERSAALRDNNTYNWVESSTAAMLKAMKNTANGADDLANALQKSTQKIESMLDDMIEGDKKSKVKDMADKLFGKILSKPELPNDPRQVALFEEQAQALFKQLRDGTASGGTAFGSVNEQLTRLMNKASFLGPAFGGIVDELKKLAQVRAPGTLEPPKQIVEIHVMAAPEFIAEVRYQTEQVSKAALISGMAAEAAAGRRF